MPSDGLQANLRSFAQNTHGTRTLDQRRSGSAERVGVAVRLPSQQARVLERLSTLLRAGMHGWRHIVEAACDYGLVDLSDRRGRLAIRLTTLVAGQLAMLALMFALLETYEPEPNGFRFDTAAKLGSFAVLTLAPIVIGLAARRFAAAAAVALLQALSPLLLLANMRDPGSDLNFAVLLWWIPLPAAAALVVIVDRSIGTPTRTGPTSPATR